MNRDIRIFLLTLCLLMPAIPGIADSGGGERREAPLLEKVQHFFYSLAPWYEPGTKTPVAQARDERSAYQIAVSGKEAAERYLRELREYVQRTDWVDMIRRIDWEQQMSNLVESYKMSAVTAVSGGTPVSVGAGIEIIDPNADEAVNRGRSVLYWLIQSMGIAAVYDPVYAQVASVVPVPVLIQLGAGIAGTGLVYVLLPLLQEAGELQAVREILDFMETEWQQFGAGPLPAHVGEGNRHLREWAGALNMSEREQVWYLAYQQVADIEKLSKRLNQFEALERKQQGDGRLAQLRAFLNNLHNELDQLRTRLARFRHRLMSLQGIVGDPNVRA